LVRDREALVAALRARGVDWLAPSDAEGAPVPDEILIASLAASEEARLRQALIGLFLLHSALAPLVLKLRPEMEAVAEIELIAHYTAAVYLQHMWRVRLSHYLPPFADLPDYFSKELGLPAPEDEYGKVGLHALAAWQTEHAQRAQRANHLSEYEGVADLLFERLKSKAKHVAASIG
jgi:hypothetical protein